MGSKAMETFWQGVARKRVARSYARPVAWVEGSGPFAVVTHCGDGPVTVELAKSPAEALKARRRTDAIGCGPSCRGEHDLVAL